MSLKPPQFGDPIYNEDKSMNPSWVLFFNQAYIGDLGVPWTPTFQNLGTSGTPSFSGRYYKLSQELAYFRIDITPGTSTTSTQGSTYCDNFPLTVRGMGLCAAVGGSVGVGIGAVQTTGRIYLPGWSGVTVPVSIVGICEAK